jgi:hypothetical protein
MSLAERRVLHSRCVGAEIAALSLYDGTGCGRSRLSRSKPLQHGFWPGLPEMIQGGVRPRLCLSRVVAMDGLGNRPDVFAATARRGVDHSVGSVTRAGARSFPVPSWPTAAHFRAGPAPPCARLPALHLRARPSWYPDVAARVSCGLGQAAAAAVRSHSGGRRGSRRLPRPAVAVNIGGSLLVIRQRYPVPPPHR